MAVFWMNGLFCIFINGIGGSRKLIERWNVKDIILLFSPHFVLFGCEGIAIASKLHLENSQCCLKIYNSCKNATQDFQSF